jgi:hypothetical protein
MTNKIGDNIYSLQKNKVQFNPYIFQFLFFSHFDF